MATFTTPEIACYHCLGTFPRAAIARHQARCIGAGDHLRIGFGTRRGAWWLVVTVAPGGTLADLDRHLRTVWLECCGHLSSFLIGDADHSSTPSVGGWGPPGLSMDVPAASVLRPGDRFRYIYDWGSSTELEGQVFTPVRAGAGDRVETIARNNPLGWRCGCGQPAVWACGNCGEAMSCGAEPDCPVCHAPLEEAGLPVVNSPRVGVCAYAG